MTSPVTGTSCSATLRHSSGTSPDTTVPARPSCVTSSDAPLSARICATCARLSSGLTGTCTSPARAAASGITQASRVLGSQVATRAPAAKPCSASHDATAPTMTSSPAKSSAPARSTKATSSGRPRRVRASIGRGMGSSAIMPLDSRLVGPAKARSWHPPAQPLLRCNMSGTHSGIAVHIDDNDQVDATVRAVLHDVLGIDAARVAAFRSDTPLFGALPELDSMAVGGLLAELEGRLGVLIEDDEVDGEMLETFGALVRFMTSKALT